MIIMHSQSHGIFPEFPNIAEFEFFFEYYKNRDIYIG